MSRLLLNQKPTMITKKKTQISGFVNFDIPQKIQIIQSKRNAVLLEQGKTKLTMSDIINEACMALIKKEGV
jgi:hypothetical protein